MDARQFLAEFGHIVSASGGVQRLRELVLYLATHGELSTGGVSNLQEALNLIRRASILKERLVANGQARRQEPFPSVAPLEERKYPATWAVTRLGNVVHLLSGQHLSPDQQNGIGEGIPYFTGASDFGRLHPIVRRWTNIGRAIAVAGDILIAVKGTIGTINLLDLNQAALGRQLMAVRAIEIDAQFLALILRAHESHFVAKSIGIAIPGISREDILHLIVGVPSVDEQRRIVAKVDELMAGCDKLEAQQKRLSSLHRVARVATLESLMSARNPDELQCSFSRLLAHQGLLLKSKDDSEQLRDAISQLGVMGRLTKATSEEQPVDQLASIRQQAYLMDSLELRQRGGRVPELPPFREVAASDCPGGWRAITLESACTFIIDCPHSTPRFSNDGYFCVDTTCIEPGKIFWDKIRKVDAQSFAERISRLKPKMGDVFFSREGTIGTAVALSQDLDICLGQRMMMFRFAPFVLPKFAEIFLMSGYFKGQYAPLIKGTAAKHLNIGDIRRLTIFVPSLPVQEQIVASIGGFDDRCRRLDSLLASQIHLAELLSKAAIAAITGIRVEDKEDMKAPKTELVSRLRLGAIHNDADQAPLAAILSRNKGELPAKILWQMSGLEIDDFYRQLATEMARGWIVEPEPAYVQEVVAG